MPVVRLEVRSGWSPQDKKALLDATHTAMVEALKIPQDDRTQRIVEHASEDFELPPDKGERFVLVEVTLFAGRSLAAKRRLYRALVRNIGALGVAPLRISPPWLQRRAGRSRPLPGRASDSCPASPPWTVSAIQEWP